MPLAQKNIDLVAEFINYLGQTKGLSANSCAAYQHDLQGFSRWLSVKQIDLINVDSKDINQYFYGRMVEGYKASSNARLLSCFKGFYRFLLGLEITSHDPCFGLQQPKVTRVAANVLSATEIDAIMAAPLTSEILGLRDRAMLEVLYSCGMKVSELLGLRLGDVDAKRAELKVKNSDGQFRSVWLTRQCCHWLQKYQQEGRCRLIKRQSNDWLFLSERGLKMTRQAFWYRFKNYANQAKLGPNISPQILRRSFAVHLLSNGVELDAMQRMLGHRYQASTHQYTDL